MASNVARVLRYIRQLSRVTECDEQSDGELLRRFVTQRDEAAFVALLQRHASMVLGVCRQTLYDEHAAEDAFQATFLVLARKACSIRKQDVLAAWLHRVALNVSNSANASAVRQHAHQRQVALRSQEGAEPPLSPVDAVALRDGHMLIHEEVDALPKKYRMPVVLCYLEGKTHDQAARQLGWPLGTVKGRLARARELLRTRLTRRGLALSGGALAAALIQDAAVGQVPAVLLGHTAKAALSFAVKGTIPAGIASTHALTLAEGALQTMATTKFVQTMTLILGVALTIACALATQASPSGQAVQVGSDPPSGAQAKPQGVDIEGELLPPAAIARLGTQRFRHAGEVTTIVHFPDGKTVASGGMDDTVRLWDATTGKELRRVAGTHVALAPDGKTWATWTIGGEKDQNVRLLGRGHGTAIAWNHPARKHPYRGLFA